MKAEPTINAVAFVRPGGLGEDAILLGTRPGTLFDHSADSMSVGDLDSQQHPPDEPGVWFWRDTGSEPVYPTEHDEDGGVRWHGSWVRPSISEGAMTVFGFMPWDGPCTVSPIVVERDALVDRVAELEAEVLGLHCDLQGPKPVVPELPPGYGVRQESITGEWVAEWVAEHLYLESCPDRGLAVESAWVSFREHDPEWADFIDSLR